MAGPVEIHAPSPTCYFAKFGPSRSNYIRA